MIEVEVLTWMTLTVESGWFDDGMMMILDDRKSVRSVDADLDGSYHLLVDL